MRRSRFSLLLTLALTVVACQAGTPPRGTWERPGAAIRSSRAPVTLGVIRGVVDVAAGDIVAGAAARFALRDTRTVRASGGRVIARSRSYTGEAAIGADGAFAVSVAMGAEYVLEATVPDGAGGMTKFYSRTPINVPLAAEPTVIDARSLVTRQTGSIQGLIELRGMRPGESPEGTDVFLGGTSVVGKAGESGRFALTGVAEGKWNVVVSRPGYRRRVVPGVEVRPGRPTLLEATVVLERDQAPQAGFMGRVQGRDGLPVVGATVTAYPLQRREGAEGDLDAYAVVTDAAGRYALMNLPPGDYTVEVRHSSFEMPLRRPVVLAPGAAQDLGVTELERTAASTGRITGMVQDDKGAPLPEAVVRLDPPVVEPGRTDARGGFSLAGIVPGEYKLTVGAAGFVPMIVPVMVEDRPGFAAAMAPPLRLSRGSEMAEAPTMMLLPPVVPTPPATPAPSPASPAPPAPSATVGVSASPATGVPGAGVALPAGALLAAPPSPRARTFADYEFTVLPEEPQLVFTKRKVSAADSHFVDDDGVLFLSENSYWTGIDPGGAKRDIVNMVHYTFFSPADVAYQGGCLYLRDQRGGSVLKFAFEKDAKGGISSRSMDTLAFYLGTPATRTKVEKPGITRVAGDGTLYMLLDNAVWRREADGLLTRVAGEPGARQLRDGPGATARFLDPGDLAIGPDGSIWVGDVGLRKVSPRGVVSTVSRLASDDHRDGAAAATQVPAPRNLAVSADGDLYYHAWEHPRSGAEAPYTHVIKRLGKDGRVTTLVRPGAGLRADNFKDFLLRGRFCLGPGKTIYFAPDPLTIYRARLP